MRRFGFQCDASPVFTTGARFYGAIDKLQIFAKDTEARAAIAHRDAYAKRVARRLGKQVRRIVNAVRYDLNNGRLEGFNNLISRVIHRACGHRDEEYLTLKLRHQAHKTPIPL